MDILVCIQHNFVMPCGVLLLSLITNNSREEVHIHCICNRDVTNDDKASLRKIVEGETQNSIQYYTSNYCSLTFHQYIKSNNSPASLAECFMHNYERPNLKYANIPTRRQKATDWCNYF